ncbi:MAG TPA: DUF2061 domain-containing protein [Planctomycetota bacterium]|nr:DUF2061 domain-containing protein [Planctomycetota bacterium]
MSVEILKDAELAAESHLRSVVKAVTWRIGGSIFTALIALAVTREATVATTIGLADLVVKIAAFYVHERIWERIPFGRRKPPDYQI